MTAASGVCGAALRLVTEDTEKQSMPLEKRSDLSEAAIGAAMEVHRILGPGFREITYGNAYAIELKRRRIGFERELPVDLHYKGESIGEGKVDFLIERDLIVELKATQRRTEAFKPQVTQYLRALDLHVALLINSERELLKEGIHRAIRD